MGDSLNEYEQLVIKEDLLVRRVQTCEDCSNTLLDSIYQNMNSIDIDTLKDILGKILEIQNGIRSDLILTRITKCMVAGSLNKKST